ncbi:hypothetical protein [Chitinibacter sp. ZOR0017]|uniref:hypothetical protein n=1 Tax=Chitinibacter sp. ZOR0017 TaxID=1339254 RepID=UPI0006454CBF|nr:hypothetical protein [Chitinibacter sp. ZOR0017]
MIGLFEEINKLTLEKSEFCTHGKFCRAFLEKNPVITQKIIPYIETSSNCKSFHSKVMRIYTENHENEKRAILRKIEERSYNPGAIAFYAPLLEEANRKLTIKTYHELLSHIEENINEFPGILEILNNSFRQIHGNDDQEYIRRNYASYYIGSILYSKHELLRGRMEVLDLKYSSVVQDEYSKIGIDLKKEDAQFSKYSLLNLNSNISIYNNKDSQTIKDCRIDKYFWIDVPRKLLFTIEDLIKNKFISDISFRVDYVSDLIPIMEEMETGSPLKLKVSTLPKLSKFYSKENYGDNLWVRHDTVKSSLTFEELIEDFEIVGDDIITQVVHLEYALSNDEYLITHLDHELILYTLEEYEKRLSNPDSKGYKKIKTFKIDNANIPFYFKKEGEYFLFQVLDAYLKNTALISEYFEKI